MSTHRALTTALAAALCLCLAACGDAVDCVREARIQPDPSVTVAEALERYPYFTNVAWSEHETRDGKTIVEAACELNVSANCREVSRESLEVATRDVKRDYFLAQFVVDGFPRQVRAQEAIHVTICAGGKKLTFADPKYLRAIYNREQVRFFCFEGLNCPGQ